MLSLGGDRTLRVVPKSVVSVLVDIFFTWETEKHKRAACYRRPGMHQPPIGALCLNIHGILAGTKIDAIS